MDTANSSYHVHVCGGSAEYTWVYCDYDECELSALTNSVGLDIYAKVQLPMRITELALVQVERVFQLADNCFYAGQIRIKGKTQGRYNIRILIDRGFCDNYFLACG